MQKNAHLFCSPSRPRDTMPQSTDPARSAETPDSLTQIPLQLGPWQVRRQIVRGALTTVYQVQPAMDCDDQGACYAAKVLDRRYHNDATIVELFRREAAAGRTLEHPNLVSVLDCQISAPPFYLVMPQLIGQTLAERLSEGWQPTPLAATWIARQIAAALGAVHRHGLLHGDLKPANIHTAPNGHATLLDLGFIQRPASTANEIAIGTAHYVAPEVLLGAGSRDIRSDIYSLGAVLFEMLSGKPPLQADSLADLAEQHRQSRPVDVRSTRPDVPRELAELVTQMLAKQSLRRPQTPDEVVRRLVRMEVGLFASSTAA